MNIYTQKQLLINMKLEIFKDKDKYSRYNSLTIKSIDDDLGKPFKKYHNLYDKEDILISKKRKFETEEEKQERLSKEKIEERDDKLKKLLDGL